MMSAKLATIDLLKVKVFSNKGYDIINFVQDVNIKFLSHVSNYIVEVFMSPKFGNSSIPVRDVVIISIL